MAKARYDIGSRTGGMIGQLQYPREMKSTVVIEWYVAQKMVPHHKFLYYMSLTALNSCFVLCIVHGCEHEFLSVTGLI